MNGAAWSLTRGTGYYRLVNHLSSPRDGLDAGYQAESNSADNLRGTTTWCYA